MTKFTKYFICYSTIDAREFAYNLYRFFESANIDAFCDLIDDPNYQLQGEIYDEIRKCHKFVFLNSQGATESLKFESSWISKEVNCAIEAGLEIINVHLSRTFTKPYLDNNLYLNAPKIILHGNPKWQELRLTNLENILFNSKFKEYKIDSNVDNDLIDLDIFEKYIKDSVKSMGYISSIADSVFTVINNQSNKYTTTERLRNIAEVLSEKELSVYSRALLGYTIFNASRNEKTVNAIDLWKLALQSIETSDCQLRISSQGFIVIPLFSSAVNGNGMEHIRLHIWTDNLPVKQNKDYIIHSHQSFAQSWVVCGQIENKNYQIEEAEFGERSEYQISWSNDGNYSPSHKYSSIENTFKRVNVNLIDTSHFRVGDSYTINAGHFHSTQQGGNGITATFFLFDSSQGWKPDAKVIGPYSGIINKVDKHYNTINIQSIFNKISNIIENECH